MSIYSEIDGQRRLRFADFTRLIGPGQNTYLLRILVARPPSGFFFRGDSLLLYRRLWKLFFDNIEILTELQTLIRKIILEATNRKDSIMKIKAAMAAIGLEEKTHIREQLEQRLRFYASA